MISRGDLIATEDRAAHKFFKFVNYDFVIHCYWKKKASVEYWSCYLLTSKFISNTEFSFPGIWDSVRFIEELRKSFQENSRVLIYNAFNRTSG